MLVGLGGGSKPASLGSCAVAGLSERSHGKAVKVTMATHDEEQVSIRSCPPQRVCGLQIILLLWVRGFVFVCEHDLCLQMPAVDGHFCRCCCHLSYLPRLRQLNCRLGGSGTCCCYAPDLQLPCKLTFPLWEHCQLSSKMNPSWLFRLVQGIKLMSCNAYKVCIWSIMHKGVDLIDFFSIIISAYPIWSIFSL